MNIYMIGMSISMVVYIIIGFIVSRKVKSAEDFYVAGRQAPVLLIAGSMIASYTSTGMFMGDAAQCYDGVFAPMLILSGMQCAGYILGSVFFGKYLRRSEVLTIPEFFGKRFCSEPVKVLASVISIITMSVYLLSIMQGIATLMNAVTGVNYKICIVIALGVFTIISVASGSKGVLITDTLMASVFTTAVVFSVLAISHSAGGWYDAIGALVSDPSTADVLSWHGKLGVLYDTGIENIVWGFVYGIVWLSVCMVGPWQSSRYLMAKNEHTVVRAAVVSAVCLIMLEFLVGIAAVMVNVANPNMQDSSQVMLWAAMNMMPELLGVILLTGVLSAGISSATTFLSLIGSSVANDIMDSKSGKSIFAGRITMIVVSILVLLVAVFNPPSIFWIMFLGGAIVASAWMPIAVACVFSKRLTKTGVFCGMLAGFLACFLLKLYSSLTGVTLPVYLDPSIVGMGCNILAMCVGTMLTKVTEEEKAARLNLFVIPETEKNIEEIRKTMKYTKWSIGFGGIVVLLLMVLWVVPFVRSL